MTFLSTQYPIQYCFEVKDLASSDTRHNKENTLPTGRKHGIEKNGSKNLHDVIVPCLAVVVHKN